MNEQIPGPDGRVTAPAERERLGRSGWFNDARGRSLLTGVSVSQVPDLYLLLALAERLRA
ncbi:hypothetical protein [Streptomyces aureoversilis]|uniref:Uncharacterized protein n=1 Tax=Streptomyces aureoversilis TaxID=67277 RepID=A0ABW0A6L7_9ACTN